MTTINFVYVDLDGQETEVAAVAGETLMDVATSNNVAGIDGDCGGCCACGTCRVRLPDALGQQQAAMQDDERDVLEFAEGDNEGARLGCQIQVTEAFAGTRITVATTS